jgi:hypothetical protein
MIYRYLVFDQPLREAEKVQKEFNELAKEGWEFVTAIPNLYGMTRYIFKRPEDEK